MCDEYWERELERRRRLLASEDETAELDKMEIESNSEPNAPIIVPGLLSLKEKRRAGALTR